MVMGNSYRLTNIIVRSYQQVKYLSMPKEGATIVQIEDIGKVADADTAENYITITTAEVVGVQRLDMYSACLACKAKVSPTSEILGSCSKCDMVQRIDRCKKQLSAKLIIADGAEYITLNAFGSNVMDIAQQEVVTIEGLLAASPFSVTYDNNVITSIGRS